MKFIYSNSLRNPVEAASGLYYENFNNIAPAELEFGPWDCSSFAGSSLNFCQANPQLKPEIKNLENGLGLNSGGVNSSIFSARDLTVNCFPIDHYTKTAWRKIRLGYFLSLDTPVVSVPTVQFGLGLFDVFNELTDDTDIYEWQFQGFYQETNGSQSAGLAVNNIGTENAYCRTSGFPYGGCNLTVRHESESRAFQSTGSGMIYPCGHAGFSSIHVYVEIDRGLEPDEWKVFIGTASSARPRTEAQFKERLQLGYGALSGNFADESGGPIAGYSYQSLTVPNSDTRFMSHFGMISNRADLRLDAVGYYVIEELPTKIDIITGAPETSESLPDGDNSAPVLGPDSVYFKFSGPLNILSYNDTIGVLYRNAGETDLNIMPCDIYINNEQKYTDSSFNFHAIPQADHLFKTTLSEAQLSNIEELVINGGFCYEAVIPGLSSIKGIKGLMEDGATIDLGGITTLERVDLKTKHFHNNFLKGIHQGVDVDLSNQNGLISVALNSNPNVDFDLSSKTSLQFLYIKGGRSLITPNATGLDYIEFESKNGTTVDLGLSVNASEIKILGSYSGNIIIADSSNTEKIKLEGDFTTVTINIPGLPNLINFTAKGTIVNPIDISSMTGAAEIYVGNPGGVNGFGVPNANTNLIKLSIAGSGNSPIWSDWPNLKEIYIQQCGYASIDVSGSNITKLKVEDITSSIVFASTLRTVSLTNTGDVMTGGFTSLDLSSISNLDYLIVREHNLTSMTFGGSYNVNKPYIMVDRCSTNYGLIIGIANELTGSKIWDGVFRYALKDSEGGYAHTELLIGTFRDLCIGRLWVIGYGNSLAWPSAFELTWPYDQIYDFSTQTYNAVDDLYEYDPLP